MAAACSVYRVGCPGYSALATTKACQRALGSVKTSVGIKFNSNILKSSSCWVKNWGWRCQPVASLPLVEENGKSKDPTEIAGCSVETEKVWLLHCQDSLNWFIGLNFRQVLLGSM